MCESGEKVLALIAVGLGICSGADCGDEVRERQQRGRQHGGAMLGDGIDIPMEDAKAGIGMKWDRLVDTLRREGATRMEGILYDYELQPPPHPHRASSIPRPVVADPPEWLGNVDLDT